jgi:N-acylglucosamine 2-epimerase
MPPNFSALLERYRSELLDRVVPFWMKYGIDWQNGGINTCITDDGRILSEDKYVWSQLRAVWTFSALYNMIEPRQEWLDVATHIFNFIKRCGRNDKGEWLFCLAKDGTPRFDGATSIYCDGFAIYGFTEFAKAAGNQEAIACARATYASARQRLARPGSYQTHPLPIPPGLKAHGISMIFALAFDALGHYLNETEIIGAGLAHANQVMDVFLRPEQKRLYEFVRLDDSLMDAPPGRAVNPGHAIESMWFMTHIFQRHAPRNAERIRQAIDAIRWHVELGWDDEYGGIVLARDAEGSFWEKNADAKIWWPHTEALYALLLAYSISKEDWCLEWFKRVHDYAFSHFPVPQYGEWIQNLDRQGNKLNAAIALPVKDPFHLARALIYSVGVLKALESGD